LSLPRFFLSQYRPLLKTPLPWQQFVMQIAILVIAVNASIVVAAVVLNLEPSVCENQKLQDFQTRVCRYVLHKLFQTGETNQNAWAMTQTTIAQRKRPLKLQTRSGSKS